jgi:hypothetical protein
VGQADDARSDCSEVLRSWAVETTKPCENDSTARRIGAATEVALK